ncbi:hypothetical protein OS493_037462 [Desmophyllum pertusum]|uniref:Selenoprotein O n=1 Tax=Desmophyllum pertusum TaxID=174260 RepID=A0A9X0D1A7_9CNID|nr:hypothetical protein OS493_037462 [Desmophyllum pertusum]
MRNHSRLMATLETLNFDNVALRSLPIDKETQNVVRQVEAACFTLVEPTAVENPTLVAYSADALSLLDLPQSEVSRPEFVQYTSGNKLLPGSQTAAHCYCGHQQGYFSGQLGDGAAMYLGEVINSKEERWEIHLKGTGLTPFSNHRDGRKVLRSSIREFLCSEAMFHLGIPTTRAGCCVTSDTLVGRDQHYTGTTTKERASLSDESLLNSHANPVRFGSFEIFKTADPMTGYPGPSAGRVDILHQLLGYTIKNFFPQIYSRDFQSLEECYLAFYKELTLLTAHLVADWQCVGFCHGVLNSDNMSIIGVTIDYGPYGFLDYYDPNYLSQSSDLIRHVSGVRFMAKNEVEKNLCHTLLLDTMEITELILLTAPFMMPQTEEDEAVFSVGDEGRPIGLPGVSVWFHFKGMILLLFKKFVEWEMSTQEEKEKNDMVVWTEWIRTYKARLESGMRPTRCRGGTKYSESVVKRLTVRMLKLTIPASLEQQPTDQSPSSDHEKTNAIYRLQCI